jgi:hypothetical protein
MSEGHDIRLSRNVFGPTGQQYVSPGQRPGTVDRPAFSALKGRHDGGVVSPFQGFHSYLIFLPRAMPWADMEMPRWRETQIAQCLRTPLLVDVQCAAVHVPSNHSETLFLDNQ